MSLPKTYKAVVAKAAGAPLELIDIELKRPGPGQVLVKVLACGVCHSDVALAEGYLGPVFPRVPGHEVVGDIVEVGEGVTRLSVGERVGGPWHGGHDKTCRACQRGQFQMCDNQAINGVSIDGGYAEYVLLREEATARVPKELDVAEVAPLLCAGVTVFNGIRKMQIEQGNLVAVQGIGGLGHLAIQYASKMGYRVVVISSGPAKKDFAHQLGATDYIDSSAEDPIRQLKKLGGAALVVATAPSSKAISPLIGGLQPAGKILLLGIAGNVEFDSVPMIQKGLSVYGWPSGHALDCEEAIEFAQVHGVKCLVERFPMKEATEATARMTSGKVRFRSVLLM